jgi:hypothetical protein
MEDDRVSRNPAEEANQVREGGDRSDRLDARLALEKAPESRAYPLVVGGDQYRDGGSTERNRLDGHGDKHRRDVGSTHPRAGLNGSP